MLSPQLLLCFTLYLSVVSAQSEGSCVGRCGQGYFRGDPCHCDYTCMTYMECCLDYKTVCTTEGSCQGRCHEGFIRGQTCDCDSSCVGYGKCCPDYEEHCAKPVQKQTPPRPPPQLPDPDPRDNSPKPSRKPEESIPEPVPEDEIQRDEAVPKKGKKSLPINKKDQPKTSTKFSQSPPKKTTKRSPRRTRKKMSRNLSTEEDDTEDPSQENQNSSPSSKISRKRSPRRSAKKRYRKVILPEEDEEDPYEGNAPASRPNKKSPKKDKKNTVYSTPIKPKKKRKKIIYEYEDEPEDPNERASSRSQSKNKKTLNGKSPKNPKKKKSDTLVESEEETEDPKERSSSRLTAKGKINPQGKSPKKKKSETLVESEEEIEESEDNVSSSSFSSSSSSSSVKGSKKTKKLSRKNQMKKKPQDEDDIPDPDNPGTKKKPKDKDGEPKNPKSPKTREGDDDPDKPEIPPQEPNQRNPNDKGDKPKKNRGPTSKERDDDAERPDKNPKEPNQRNPNGKGDKPKEPRGPTSKERGDDAEGRDKNSKEPNQRNPNDKGDKPKEPRGPTSKERGDDVEGRDKNPKEPNQRNPNDKGDKPKEPRGPTSKERDDFEGRDKNPKEPNQKNPNDKGDKLKEPRSPTSKEIGDDGEGRDKNPKDQDDKDGKPKKPKVKNGDDPEDPDPLPKERLPKSPKDEDDKPQKTKTSKIIENTEEETEQDENNEENTAFSSLKNTRKRSPANANKRPKKPNSRENAADSPRKPLPSDKRKKNPSDNKPNKKKKVNPEDDADDESPKPGKGKNPKKKPSPKDTVKRKKKVDSEEERQETVSEFSSSSQSSSSHSRSKSIRRKTGKNKKNLKEKKKFPGEEEPENPLMPPKKKHPLPTPVYTTPDEGSGDGSGMDFLQTTIVSTTKRLNTTTSMATTVGTKITEGTLKPSIHPQTESINGSSSKTTTSIPIPESTEKQSAGSSATTVLYAQSSTHEEKTKEPDTTTGTTPQQSKNNISITVNGMDISVTLLTSTPAATFNEESTKPAHKYESTIEQQDMETKAKSTQDSLNNPVNMDMTTPYPGTNNGEKVETEIGNTVKSGTNSKVTTVTISPSHFDTDEKLNKEMITYSFTAKKTTEQPPASTDQRLHPTSHQSNGVFSESFFKTTKNAYLNKTSFATGSTEKAYSLHDEADNVNTNFPAGTAEVETNNESKTTVPFSDKQTVSINTTSVSTDSASTTQLAQTSIIMATDTNSKDSYSISFTTEAKAFGITNETPRIDQAVSTLHTTQSPLKDSTNTPRSMDTTERENIPQSTTVAEVTTTKEERLATTDDNRNLFRILTTAFTNLLYSTTPGEDKSVPNIFTIEQTSAKMDTIYATLTEKQHSTPITLTEQTTTLSTPSLEPTNEQSTQQPPDTTLIKESSSKPIKTVASTEKTEIPYTVTTNSAQKSSSASETSTLRQTPETLHMTTDDLLIKKETNTEHFDISSVTIKDKIKVLQTTDNSNKVSSTSTIQENLTTLKEITESKSENPVSSISVQNTRETTEATDIVQSPTTAEGKLLSAIPSDATERNNQNIVTQIIKISTDTPTEVNSVMVATENSADYVAVPGETVNELLPNSTSSTTSIESTTDKLQTTLQPKVEMTKVLPFNEVTDVKEATTGLKPLTAEMLTNPSLITTDISQKSTSETFTSQVPATYHSDMSSTIAIDILKARHTTENINADQFPSTIQGKLLTSKDITESEIIKTVTPTAKISTEVPSETEFTEHEIYNTVTPTAKMTTEVPVEKDVTENEIYNTVMPTTKISTEVPVEKDVTENEIYKTVMPTTKMSTEVPVEKEKVTENEIYNTVMPTTKMSTEVPVEKEKVTENEIYNTVMPTTKMSTEVPAQKEMTENEIYNTVMPTTKISTEVPVEKVTENEIYNTVMPTTKMSTEVPVEKVTENEIYNTAMPTTKMSTEVPVEKEKVTENEIYNTAMPTTKMSTEVPVEKEKVTENEIYNTVMPTTKISTEVPVEKVTENEIYNTVMPTTKMSTEEPVEKKVTENEIYNTVMPTTKMSTEVPVEKVTENEIYNTVMPTTKMSTEVPAQKEMTENEIYNTVMPTTKISTEVPVEKEKVTENEIYNTVMPTTKMSTEVPVEKVTDNEIYNTAMPTTKMSTDVPVEIVTENEIYNTVMPTTKMSTEVSAQKEMTENEIYNTVMPTTKMSTEVPVEKEKVTENEIYNTVMPTTKMSTEVPVEKITENEIYNTVMPTTKMSTEEPVEKKVTENEIYNTVMPTTKMSTEEPVEKVTENEIYNTVMPTTKISTEVPIEKVTENEIYNTVMPTTKMSTEEPVEKVTENEIYNTVMPTSKMSTEVPLEKVTENDIYNTVMPTTKMSTEEPVEKVTENEIYNTVMPTTKISTEVPLEKVTENDIYNTVMPTTKMSTEEPVEKVTENEIYNTVMPTTKMSTEVPAQKEMTENEIYNTVMPTTKMSTEVPIENDKVTENEIYNTVMPTTKMSTEVPIEKEVTENEIYKTVMPTTKMSTEVPVEKEVTENEIYKTVMPTTKMSTEVPVEKDEVTENEIYNTVMPTSKMSTEVPIEKEVTENEIYKTVMPTTKMSTEVPVEKVTENEIYKTVMPTTKTSTEVPVEKEVTENEIYNKVTPTTKMSTEVPVEKEEVTENEIHNKVIPTTKMSTEVPVESSTIFVAKETATHNIDSIAVTKETSGMTSVKAKTEKQQTTLLPKEWSTQVTAVKEDDNARSAVTLFPVSYYTTLSDGHKKSLGTTGPDSSILNTTDTADVTKEQTIPPHKNPTQSIYITSTAPDNSQATATTKRDILSTYHVEINEIASTEIRHTPNITTKYLSSEKQTTERGITNDYTTTSTTSLQTTENQGTQHTIFTIVNTVASEPIATSTTEYKTSSHTVHTDLPIPNSTSITARSSQPANIAETLHTTTSDSVRRETHSTTASLTTTEVPHVRPTTKNMNIDKESEENFATTISTAVPVISNTFMTASEKANFIILTTETFIEDLSNFTSKTTSPKATTGTDQIKSTILSEELSASASAVTNVTTTAITSTNYHTTLSADHKTSIGLVTEEVNTLKDLDITDITKEKATTPNISPIETEKPIFNISSLPTDDHISTVTIPISVKSKASVRSPDNDKQQTTNFSEKTQLEHTSVIMTTYTNSKDSQNTYFTTEAKANALTTENPQISQTEGTLHTTQTHLKESTNTPRSMDTTEKENIPQSTSVTVATAIKDEHLSTTDDNRNNVGILINTFTNIPYSTTPGKDKSVADIFTIEQSSAKIETMYATLTEKQHSSHITLIDQTTTLSMPSLQPTKEQGTQQPPDTTHIKESSSKSIKTVASTKIAEIPHPVTTSSAQKSSSETSTLRQTPDTLHMTTNDLLIKKETDAEHAHISSLTTIEKIKVWQTIDEHTSNVAIPISVISKITIRIPDNDTQHTTYFNDLISRTPDTKSQGPSVAMESMTAQSTHDLKATDADHKNTGITMIVEKETTVATENTSDSFTTVLDKDPMADQSFAMTRNPEINFPVKTDGYNPLSTNPKSEGESVTPFTIKPSTAEVDKKRFSVPTTNTITPGSSAFKMLHKIQTTVEATDVSSHNILSVLPTMRPKNMSTGKTDAGDAQVTSESIESPSFPTKGHLPKIIFGTETNTMSTSIKENVSGQSTFTTLKNTVNPKHSPYFHTMAVVSGITKVSGSSAQGLDTINTNQHANINVTSTPPLMKSSITKSNHMNDVLESGINNLHEPSFNFTVSTLKTPQDQSTADSNAKHTTPRLEGTAVTTSRLEGTAVTTSRLEGTAVTTSRLEGTAVTTPGLEGTAVTTSRLEGIAITTPGLEGTAVTTSRLEGSAVTTPGLEGSAVQHKSTPMGPTKHTPESGLTTTSSHSSLGKDSGTSPKTQTMDHSTNKINEYSTTSAPFSTRNPNESKSQTSTNPTTRHADDIITKDTAETTTTGQSVKMTTRQPDMDQTTKQPGQRPIPGEGSSYETTTKQSPNAKTTSIPRRTTAPNLKDSFTTMPINKDDIETNKATTPHTIHPHHICNLLKDEAISLRIPESDLKLITEICAEMQQQYPNINIPSLQTRQPNIDIRKIPPEYPLSEGTPNFWSQPPGSKLIQIIEEIYRRIYTSPTTNLTGIPGQDNHRSTAWLLLINKIKRATDPQMNLCVGPPADGMTTLQNGSMVVFRGHYFWTLNQGGATGMPRKISEVWGIPSPIDTVFTRCNCGGKTFFFKGPRYWRFTNDAMDKGYPKEIIKGFGGLGGKVTAVLSVAGIKTRPESVYFFKPGGNVQKYTFRQEQTKRCTKKKQPSVNYPIYSQRVQTVKFRFPRDIVRHRIEIRRTFSNIPQPLGILHEQRSVRSTWRGIPSNIVSAVSLPNPLKQDGFDYFVFTKDKYYNINMSSKVAMKPPAGAEQKTTKDFYKCKE